MVFAKLQSLAETLPILNDWHRARHVSLVLCGVQQRLETQMMVNPGIPVLTAEEPRAGRTSVAASGPGSGYAVARDAEVFAMTEALRFQDAIPKVTALSLPGIVAKLEMIVGADRDIGDPTDFPCAAHRVRSTRPEGDCWRSAGLPITPRCYTRGCCTASEAGSQARRGLGGARVNSWRAFIGSDSANTQSSGPFVECAYD